VIPLSLVKSRLKITGTGDDTVANDAVLQRLIDGATAALSRELGRYLGPPAEQRETRHGGPYKGLPVIFLFQDPVADTDVTVATRTAPGQAWEDVDAADYVLEGRALRHASAWPAGRANVRIIYTAGYAVGAGPLELLDLVTDLVALRWGARSENAAMQSETFGDYSYTRRDLDGVEGWQTTAGRWRRAMT
jgi:hypothetical protein